MQNEAQRRCDGDFVILTIDAEDQTTSQRVSVQETVSRENVYYYTGAYHTKHTSN